ncbi:GNAT family N-acetyltransferase [Sphingobacterium psychroaquaticum]|uniref:Acetyltransferase (GNAT) domain-containing protein n=1 Tax=Sphingobacterium psychroaquaticum TaxID=561061 RepID=A0A1X7JLJ1_9SPHI|nr:GNAT family N-acetyltransferase [Sphingobacterium psychroaquaticum]SMG28486.1 Acetyltransferase (GNAT) domain-containing protein [Sphingobacterium psychroaquaticum]
MYILKRTTATDSDFEMLIQQLDADLAVRNGEEQAFFSQFNHLNNIKHVIVAYQDNKPIGCGAIKTYDADTMEVKRMFIIPEMRRQGIGLQLLMELEKWTSELGYAYTQLETGTMQPEAIRLYEKNGYTRIPNYDQYVGIENSVCFKKKMMKTNPDYLQVNKESWNKRTAVHIDSDFYNQAAFLQGETSLNNVELELLGDIKGKKILHLQCHFGQDTISLARLGAQVTGVDLSDKAVEVATELATKTGADATFIASDVYELPNVLNAQFDIVFTSYGTIGWLPDLDKWAKVISTFLKPQGRLVFVEFHPVVWMFDDDFQKVGYNYFKDEPIIETTEGTYADREADLQVTSVTWNHSLSEVMTSLLQNGLSIASFSEYDYSPYNCFNHTIQIEEKKFRIKHLGNNIPMLYALEAVKR